MPIAEGEHYFLVVVREGVTIVWISHEADIIGPPHLLGRIPYVAEHHDLAGIADIVRIPSRERLVHPVAVRTLLASRATLANE